MLKQKIKYTDFDGNEAEEVCYFNLSKIELMEMEVGGTGGSFRAWIQRIIDSDDKAVLIAEFKRLILLAYGIRSEDGKRFIKNDQIREEFSQTSAFESLFLDMAEKEGVALAFVRGILPADLATELDKEERKLSPPNPPAA
jgi:hypothetical protein